MDPDNFYSKRISIFWKNSFQKLVNNKLDIKSVKIPLARIKKLMKVEEQVKMVASEVPILFSLITEVFIEELTLRSWMSTKENRRKILQASDIAFAAKTSSMYDFLIYIIPNGNYMLKDMDIPTNVQFLDQYPCQERVNDLQPSE